MRREEIIELMMASMAQMDMEEGERLRSMGIGVTSLADCLRHSYLRRIHGERYDARSLVRAFVGKAIHKCLRIFPCHEMELVWAPDSGIPIVAVIDEYHPGLRVLIEKKTTLDMFGKEAGRRWIPEHYVTQVEYEAVVLQKNGYGVDEAWLVIFDYGETPEKDAVRVDLRPMEIVEAEMLGRRNVLERSLRDGTPPPRDGVGTWRCLYCNYVRECMASEDAVSMLRSSLGGA